MKYAFLTTLMPKEMEDEIRRRSKHNMQDAANALQWHIYDGFCANLQENIKLFNILPIGSFPQYYSKMFIRKSSFYDNANNEHSNIGFCNIKFLRKYHQPKKIFAQLKKWCKESDEEKTLFVYTVSAPFMIAVSKIKRLFPNLKVCAIVADLPNMSSLSNKKTLIKKIFEKNQASASYSRLGCIDAFVLLTKQMSDYMKITQPYVVVEGISTNNVPLIERKITKTKNILYTGTLHKRFGILNLIEAFKQIDLKNYKLTICGSGDSDADIKKLAEEDSRIDFKGQLKREDIIKLQQEATVLVNPRQNNEEFTKYSFPSKNLEYLSSGVPLVAYKLDGIPDEYDRYINYVNNDSVKSLTQTLISVCEDIDGTASDRAISAARFVREEKNSKKQTLKIVKLLESL